MIIRNPYGFISKHYKLINLLLLVPMLYLLLKFGDIAQFFRDYISAGYSTPETNFADNYVTNLTLFITLFMLVTNIIFYIIFISKKKKPIYYLSSIIYYIILFIVSLLCHATMVSISSSGVDQTFATFVRDCANLSVYPMYIFMIIGASKGLGFNFRTLKFDNNAELQITEEDEEDIEIRLGNDNNNIKKNTIHLLRELKYYILENKFVFTCLLAVFIIVIVSGLFLNFQVYNKTYSVNQAFSLDKFTLSLKESYITNTDYRGVIISENKYFLAIKIGIENKGPAASIDKSNFRIYIDDEVIYPSYDRSSRFLDIGKTYQGETLYHNDEENPGDEYVFVYELTENQIKSNYQMRILNSITQKEGKLVSRYKNINIKPQNIIKIANKDSIGMGIEISLKETTLGNTTYKLNNFQIASSYAYKSESCNLSNNCTTITNTVVPHGGYVLLIIDDEIKWDEGTSYYKNSYKDFYGDFVTVNYSYSQNSASEAKSYSAKITNVTPKEILDKKIYEIPNNIVYAEKISMTLKIRNIISTINIK